MNYKFLRPAVLFTALLTFGFQCGEDEPFYENQYELELPVIVNPAQKEYNLNDTISISVLVNDHRLKDLKTGQLIEILCTDIPLLIYAGVRQS